MFNFIKEELKTSRKEEQALKQAVELEKQRIAQLRKDTKKSAVRKIKAIDTIGTKLDAKKDEKALNEFRATEESRLKVTQSARRRALVSQNKKPIIGIGVGIAAILIAVSALAGTGNYSSTIDTSQPSEPAIVESGDKSSSQVQEGRMSTALNDSKPTDSKSEVEPETVPPDTGVNHATDKSQPDNNDINGTQQADTSDGSNVTPDTSTQAPSPVPTPTPEPDNLPSPATPDVTYVLNTNTHKFHRPNCSHVMKMSEKNKSEFTGSRSDIIAMGYDPCQNCNP